LSFGYKPNTSISPYEAPKDIQVGSIFNARVCSSSANESVDVSTCAAPALPVSYDQQLASQCFNGDFRLTCQRMPRRKYRTETVCPELDGA